MTDEEWKAIREGLRFGQVFEGTVDKVLRAGAIGVFVDIGLGVGGFVDVLLLPLQAERWPVEGTATTFEVWWADNRKQVRLKPCDPRYLREDFEAIMQSFRPDWPQEVGRAIPEPSAATRP